MIKNLFSFQGRIRRQDYAITLFLYYIISMVVNWVLLHYELIDHNAIPISLSHSAPYEWKRLIIVLPVYAPLLVWFSSQNTKRLHDLGFSGWWQLIPFFGIWMLFGRGVAGENEYGADPKGYHRKMADFKPSHS